MDHDRLHKSWLGALACCVLVANSLGSVYQTVQAEAEEQRVSAQQSGDEDSEPSRQSEGEERRPNMTPPPLVALDRCGRQMVVERDVLPKVSVVLSLIGAEVADPDLCRGLDGDWWLDSERLESRRGRFQEPHGPPVRHFLPIA